MKKLGSLLLLSAAISTFALADISAKQAFAKLKSLQGTWVGKAGSGPDTPDSTIIYKLTGSGSALVETMFPGTDHEMITVYHLDGDKLVMTHYCAAQNQPRMRFAPGKSENVLRFNFVSGANMKPKDAHMHNVIFRFFGNDRVVSEWLYYNNGKAAGGPKFDMHREKSAAAVAKGKK